LNLKLLGMDVINFDNVIHVSFGKDSGGTNLKATFRFIDGSERDFGHREAMILLKWIEKYLESEVDPLGHYDQLPNMIGGLGLTLDEIKS
jgi:hypothetical protein